MLAGRPQQVVWSDDFNGRAGQSPDRSKWRYDVGYGWGDGELERYTRRPRNAHLDSHGHLVISALRDPGPKPGRYTSARIKTQHRFAFRYGRVAVRMQIPAGRGLWPAFWMLGANIDRVGWPTCGEFDVMELLGQQPHIVYGTVHGPDQEGNDALVGGSVRVDRSLARGFHVYAASWSPSSITISVDGTPYKTVRRKDYPPSHPWVFDHRMFMILNLALGGSWPGPPNGATRFPARLRVDWVRVRRSTAG